MPPVKSNLGNVLINSATRSPSLSLNRPTVIHETVERFYRNIPARFMREHDNSHGNVDPTAQQADNKAPNAPGSRNVSNSEGTSSGSGSPTSKVSSSSNSVRSKRRLRGCDPPTLNQKSMSTLFQYHPLPTPVADKPADPATAKMMEMNSRPPSPAPKDTGGNGNYPEVANSPLSKILKRKPSPSFRIYQVSRRYTPSASSSHSSISKVQRFVKPLWTKLQSRSYGTNTATKKREAPVPPNPLTYPEERKPSQVEMGPLYATARYLASVRAQNYLDLPKNLGDVGNIRDDLMSIDTEVREMIAVQRSDRRRTIAAEQLRSLNPLNVWNKPTLASVTEESRPGSPKRGYVSPSVAVALKDRARRLKEANQSRHACTVPSLEELRRKQALRKKARPEPAARASARDVSIRYESPKLDDIPLFDQYDRGSDSSKPRVNNRNITARRFVVPQENKDELDNDKKEAAENDVVSSSSVGAWSATMKKGGQQANTSDVRESQSLSSTSSKNFRTRRVQALTARPAPVHYRPPATSSASLAPQINAQSMEPKISKSYVPPPIAPTATYLALKSVGPATSNSHFHTEHVLCEARKF